jgi:ABC-2 type transport system ATP-binding protein
MQQKIQYVGTVIHDPSLLILDEPFSGLDPINTIMLKDFMVRAREQGKAIIFSTHVLEQAEKLCDEHCLVKNGNVILEGNIESVRAQFRKPEFRITGERLDGLRALPEVKTIDINDGAALVELHDFDQHDSFLQGALKATSLREFTTVEPELERIFIEAVQRADG